MREGFFGINVALRGLYTAQRSLDVVNHNINNVNTPGYSRQKAVTVASKPMPLYDGTGMVGTGSDVVSINRIRDEYLDFKYWSESVTYGEWETKRALLSDMEATFNEPSESGFTKILDEFFTSFQELAKDPSSSAVRSLVRERGVTLTKYFNSVANHFEKLQSDINYRVNTKVGEVNSLGMQIQQLNRQIYSAELDGNVANDLRDQRTLLIDKLSGIVNIDANEVVYGKLPDGRDDKHMVIAISGKAFIDHFNLSKLSAKQRTNKLNPEEDVDNLYQIGWEDGNSLTIRGGELKGYLDVRDGNDGANGSPLYKGVPFYVKKLNEFVRTFAKAFNEGYIDVDNDGVIAPLEDGSGHADGYGLDTDGTGPITAPTGIRFFSMRGPDGKPMSSANLLNGATALTDDPLTPGINESIPDRYQNITAKNFSISSDIVDSYANVAASDNPGEVGNIVNLNAILKLRHNIRMFTEGAPEDFMKSVVTTLGIDSQQAQRISDNQEVIVKQIENRKLSDSGVSIDEEMTNLVKYQHAYNAAAKMVSTMGEIFDILINKIG